MPEDEPKPAGGGYALVDWRLSRIEAQLGENAKNAVPVGIYNVNQQNIANELARMRKEATEETSNRVAADLALTVRMDLAEREAKTISLEQARQRKQFILTVAAGVLGAVILTFLAPILRGLGVTG